MGTFVGNQKVIW